MSYPIESDEYASLASIVVGVVVVVTAFAGVVVTWGSGSSLFYVSLGAGAVGQFFIPYGVYRQAEILSSKDYLWAPSFKLIAACALPVVSAAFGAYYLGKRARVARG